MDTRENGYAMTLIDPQNKNPAGYRLYQHLTG